MNAPLAVGSGVGTSAVVVGVGSDTPFFCSHWSTPFACMLKLITESCTCAQMEIIDQ